MLHNSKNIPFWTDIPMFRLIIPFIIGIVIEKLYHIPAFFYIVTLVVGFILLAVYERIDIYKKFVYRMFSGWAIWLALIGLGGIITHSKNLQNNPTSIYNQYKPFDIIQVLIKEPLIERSNSYKAIGQVLYIDKDDRWQQTTGDIIIYFLKEKQADTLPQYGQILVFKKSLQLITNLNNPGNINFQQYNFLKNIYYQVWLNKKDYQIIRQNEYRRWFYDMIVKIRLAILSIIKQYIPSKESQSLAAALLIGYTADIDKELLQSYSRTGVVHIISIGGMHLGMIYILVLWIGAICKINKWLPHGDSIIACAVIWIFTFIAGCLPAILRTAVMFSFIIIGKMVDRRSNTYNSMAASAFVILCVSPYALWDIGFQLSYIAVLSILFFGDMLKELWHTKFLLLKKFWDLTAVTLSAQILPIPFVIYYFHQIPLLFLLSNWVVIPLSGLILYTEIVLLLTAWFSPIAQYIGALTNFEIRAMNNYVKLLDTIPYNTISSLVIDLPQAIGLSIVVVVIFGFLKTKDKVYLWICLVTIFCIVSMRSFNIISLDRSKKLIVYNVPNHTVIEWYEGRNYTLLGDTPYINQPAVYKTYLEGAHLQYRAQKTDSYSVNCRKILARQGIVILDSTIRVPQHFVKPCMVQTLIITRTNRNDLTDILLFFHAKNYVLDSSIPFWKVSTIMASLQPHSSYCVASEGAWVEIF